MSEKVEPLMTADDLEQLFTPAVEVFGRIVDHVVEKHVDTDFPKSAAISTVREIFGAVLGEIVRAEIQTATRLPATKANLKLQKDADALLKEMMADQPIIQAPGPFNNLPPIGS